MKTKDPRKRDSATIVSAAVIAKAMKAQFPFEVASEDGEYFITFPDLPGCMSGGRTIAEALKNAEEAKRLWIETTLKRGGAVPEPASAYSGRLVLRMPKSLHRDLAARARREGVSLNQYLLSLVSRR